MHLPTYLLMMIFAFAFGLYNSFVLWQTNLFLFWISVFISIVTVVGGLLQATEEDSLNFKWMLWYTIPLALLVVSSLMSNIEMGDSLLKTFNVAPPNHVIPGTSQDYENAVPDHYLSMGFPIFALLVAKAVQFFINRFFKND